MTDRYEWMNLIEVSGQFLSEKVLNDSFPTGFKGVDALKKKQLRQAYGEWRSAMEAEGDDRSKIHGAWVEFVLGSILEYQEQGRTQILFQNGKLAAPIQHSVVEHATILAPDYVLTAGAAHGGQNLLLVKSYDPGVKLDRALDGDGWAVSPIERMTILCRAAGVRLGLVTNGENWTIVHAPIAASSAAITWYAYLWLQESITLQVFTDLLGVGRMFDVEKNRLPSLLDESAKHQDEVTDELGSQVTRAIEVLVQALDRADENRNRELLADIDPRTLYEAALTVMMRIVFLLSAEERGLLLMGDEFYEGHYAISTLLMQLRPQSEEVLERRYDAWSRLLANFRAVYGGIEHESLRLPAMGGSLFNPDRYAFLEGRNKGSKWRQDQAEPLPIDNRTVMLLLESVQMYKGRLLSYEGLDVEQIGYVYEGLLERTIVRAGEVTLSLDANQGVERPWITLAELQAVVSDTAAFEALLKERTGRAVTAIRKELKKPIEEQDANRLLSACNADDGLFSDIKKCFHLLRRDPWGYPLVYPKGAFMVVKGSDRRDTGTHYTPKLYTEAIVETTLMPLVFEGPSEGKPKEEWKLKSPSELLDLRVCDPAMGSGAFLVQVCRYLSERIVEAWAQAETGGKRINSRGIVVDEIGKDDPLSNAVDDRLELARRMVAERCLYGVDMNPLAVELAKLSIWLVTLSKGRPFGFLDHNLKSGDSLLGVADLDNLRYLSLEVGNGSSKKLFATKIDQAIDIAVTLRSEIRKRPIMDIEDVHYMADVDRQAREELNAPKIIADALVAKYLAAGNDEVDTATLGIDVGEMLSGGQSRADRLIEDAKLGLSVGYPVGKSARKPFHWALEFPEVFNRDRSGFDAIVGNPPFLGGSRITGRMGTAYRDYLVKYIAESVKGSADLVAYFFLRTFILLRQKGSFGFLAVNTIAEGDTRQVGLERITGQLGATIFFACPNEPWPGKAAVVTSRVHIHKGIWSGDKFLSNASVKFISPFLSEQEELSPNRLTANSDLSFKGSDVVGMGFVISNDEAELMLREDLRSKDVLFPYLNGEDLNRRPDQSPSRWIINFWDWPEERARTYPLPYRIVEERVKPERQRRDDEGNYVLRKPLPEKWWIYNDKRPALYHKIGRGHPFESHPRDWNASEQAKPRVLVKAITGKYCMFSFVPNEMIFSNAICIFSFDDYFWFCLLQSTIHDVWARKNGSYLKTDLRYTPSDVFDTFPIPVGLSQVQELTSIGERYHSLRASMTRERQIGLTDLYNLFHDPEVSDTQLAELRELHRRMDVTVAQLYGWDGVNLNHGFHIRPHLPEGDRMRYTISEPARIEVLRRLSKLNRERYDEELRVTASVSANTDTSLTRPPKKRGAKKSQKTDEKDLFSLGQRQDEDDIEPHRVKG